MGNFIKCLPLLLAVLCSVESFATSLDSLPPTNDTILRVPAIGLGVPDGYRKGYLGVVGGGLFFQHRTRITGHFFDPDGNASFSAGLGNPETLVGLELGVNIYGLNDNWGAPQNSGEGTISIQLNRHAGHDIWVAAGVHDLTGWQREPPNKLSSYYFAVTKGFHFKKKGYFAKSAYITLGAGNGKFRRDKDYTIRYGQPFNHFGGIALQIMREGNFIAEWNGYNAFSGISFVPFKKWPIQMLIGADDIFHEKVRLVVSCSVSFYLAKDKGNAHFYRYSLAPVAPSQTSRVN